MGRVQLCQRCLWLPRLPTPSLTSLPWGAVGADHLPAARHLGAGRVAGAGARLAVIKVPYEGVAIKPRAAALTGGTFCIVQALAVPCKEENGAEGLQKPSPE